MANKVTQENIIEMNEIYLKVGTYAETARRTGFSASTVKKYIIVNVRIFCVYYNFRMPAKKSP